MIGIGHTTVGFLGRCSLLRLGTAFRIGLPARSITRVDPPWSHAADPLRDSLAEEFLDPLDVNFEARHQTARDGEVRLGFHQFTSQQCKGELEFGICHVSTVPPAAGRVYARFGCDSWQITPR